MKSLSDINKEFDEKFPKLWHGQSIIYTENLRACTNNVKSFITTLIKEEREGVVEWAEDAKFELTPIEESVKAGFALNEANNVHSKGYGYNEALSDLQAYIKSLE